MTRWVKSHGSIRGYFFAIATIALIALLRHAFYGLDRESPYLGWTLGIVVVAEVAGFGPAMVAIVLAVVLTLTVNLGPGKADPNLLIFYTAVFFITAALIGLTGAARIAADRIIRSERLRFRQIANNMKEGVIEFDRDAQITFANARARVILGSSADLAGTSLHRFMTPEFSIIHDRAIAAYLDTGVKRLDWDAIYTPAERLDGKTAHLELSLIEYTLEDEPRFCAIIQKAHIL